MMRFFDTTRDNNEFFKCIVGKHRGKEMKIKIAFFAVMLLSASFGATDASVASRDVLTEQSDVQPVGDTTGENSAMRRLAIALSSGRAAMVPFHGSRIENNNYKNTLNPPIAGMECSIDRIASYISCYSSPIGTEHEAVTLFTWLVDELQAALPSERWTGTRRASATASIRSFTYKDQNSSAHIDIDIIARMGLGGQNAYIVSTFGWPH
ncbi:MAG TPA: hypothetical protein VIH18_09385 [Candidatus Binatia bacterium]|jgi:hypothetical protein